MSKTKTVQVAKKKPLFSIIIPAYNAESTIEACVNSVTCQKFKDYEIIIVDDGSTDRTKERAGSLAGDRIKCFHKKNGGVSSARNYGLEKAVGDWVLLLDADDKLVANSLEQLAEKIRNKDFDMLITPLAAFSKKNYRNVKCEDVYIEKKDVIDSLIYQLPEDMVNGEIIARNPGGKIIRRKMIEDNHLKYCEGLRIFEDGIFNMLAAYNSSKILFSDYMFYEYDSNNKSSRMNSFYPEIIQDNEKIYDTISSFLETINYHSPAMPYLGVELFSTSLFAISRENEKTSNKIDKIKKIKEKYINPNSEKTIRKEWLSKVLRIEYKLCIHNRYRALLLLCKVKSATKHMRGRI